MDLVNFLIDLVLASLFLSFSILSSYSIITDNFFPPRKTFPSAIPLFQSFFLFSLPPPLFIPFSLFFAPLLHILSSRPLNSSQLSSFFLSRLFITVSLELFPLSLSLSFSRFFDEREGRPSLIRSGGKIINANKITRWRDLSPPDKLSNYPRFRGYT